MGANGTEILESFLANINLLYFREAKHSTENSENPSRAEIPDQKISEMWVFWFARLSYFSESSVLSLFRFRQ